MRRQYQQSVEPPSRLVDTFRDEVRRERLLKELLVYEGIVQLGVGHTSKATVDVRACRRRAKRVSKTPGLTFRIQTNSQTPPRSFSSRLCPVVKEE